MTRLLLTILFIAACCTEPATANIVIDFEELSDFNGDAIGDGTGQYYDGYGASAASDPWNSQGASFNVGSYGPGWSYSNIIDNSDYKNLNHENQWAAYVTGADGSPNTYAIANFNEYQYNNYNLLPTITLPNGYRPTSVDVTNTTYAYWTIRNGNDYAKAFGGESGTDPDYFEAIFTGLDQAGAITGTVLVNLADYRSNDNADDYILNDWLNVDLTGLGIASSIQIQMISSDNDDLSGIRTPTYIAIDNLSLTAVPEPSGVVLLSGLAAGAGWWKRRRRLTTVAA